MKIKHSLIDRIEKFLLDSNLELNINNDLISLIYEKVYLDTKQVQYLSKNRIIKVIEYHLDSIRRDLLKIKYKRNGLSAKGIKEGYVYVISNPAWPDYLKIGSSIDVISRLDSYQTYSPLRDYKLEKYFLSYNRLVDEKALISLGSEVKNEWVRIPIEICIKYCKEKRDYYRTPINPIWLNQV